MKIWVIASIVLASHFDGSEMFENGSRHEPSFQTFAACEQYRERDLTVDQYEYDGEIVAYRTECVPMRIKTLIDKNKIGPIYNGDENNSRSLFFSTRSRRIQKYVGLFSVIHDTTVSNNWPWSYGIQNIQTGIHNSRVACQKRNQKYHKSFKKMEGALNQTSRCIKFDYITVTDTYCQSLMLDDRQEKIQRKRCQ